MNEETQTKHRGRKPGSKNKVKKTRQPRQTRPKAHAQDIQVLPVHHQVAETRMGMGSGGKVQMDFNMAYPISNFIRPVIPTVEEIDRNTADIIATVSKSSSITKQIIRIANRNPTIIQTLFNNGLDPKFLDGAYNFTLKDLVTIERVTGETMRHY